jgi:hypothetical protein
VRRVRVKPGTTATAKAETENDPTPGDALIVTATNKSEEAAGTHTLAADTEVLVLALVGSDKNQTPFYVFFHEAGARLIPVTLTADGGSNGTATTTPSYTYKWPVDLLTGNEIKKADGSRATGLGPTWARNKGEFARGTNGLVYINTDGDPVLYQVDETEQVCE